jgi:hypothetical protein
VCHVSAVLRGHSPGNGFSQLGPGSLPSRAQKELGEKLKTAEESGVSCLESQGPPSSIQSVKRAL